MITGSSIRASGPRGAGPGAVFHGIKAWEKEKDPEKKAAIEAYLLGFVFFLFPLPS